MGSLVAEIAERVASSSAGARSELEIRGGAASPGTLLLSTAETSVVDGNKLGQIDFQAPVDAAGTDAILVAASIYAEADATFSSSVNQTELVFATGASEAAAEKMRIASDGKVGIGTSAPASLLDVQGTVQVGVDDTGYDVKFFGASAGAFMLYDESADTLEIRGPSADASTSTGKLLLSTAHTDINDGDVLGRIDFKAPLEAGGTDAILAGASIWAEADATFSASVNSTELVFATGASEAAVERMRINSAGNIGIGTDPTFTVLNEGALELEAVGDQFPGVRIERSGGSSYTNKAFEILVTNTGGLNFYDATSATARMIIDTNGHITKPTQPAFLCHGGDGSPANMASNDTITFPTEIYDQNGDFASNTFTAPVTGKYQLNAQGYLYGWDVDYDHAGIQIVTSNRPHQFIDSGARYDADALYFTCNVHSLCDMDANDTAYVKWFHASGANQVDGSLYCFFSGYLAC